jgi:hypothetical protein
MQARNIPIVAPSMPREPPDLKSLFLDFCERFDNKLQWKKRGEWNGQILSFFAEKAENLGYLHLNDYMLIDQVWWSEFSDIELAIQHEGHVTKVPQLFVRPDHYPQEVRQLIDIKAVRKILIVYVSEADEKSLVYSLTNWLSTHRLKIAWPSEQYMVIIGRSVRKDQRPAILFRRYLFYNNGSKMEEQQDRYLTQRTS